MGAAESCAGKLGSTAAATGAWRNLVNEVEAGQNLIELRCPRCGQFRLEVSRAQRGRTARP